VAGYAAERSETAKAAFHYSNKLQTWLQAWSQTCVSVSQAVESMSKAGRKPAANLLQTCFKQNRC